MLSIISSKLLKKLGTLCFILIFEYGSFAKVILESLAKYWLNNGAEEITIVLLQS